MRKIISALFCSILFCSVEVLAMGQTSQSTQETNQQQEISIPEVAKDGTVPIAEGPEPYPHLNSMPDGKAAPCKITPEEAAWLTARMREGRIRLATEADKQAWYVATTSNKKIVDCGRVFTVIKPLVIIRAFNVRRDETASQGFSFIVAEGTPFPKTLWGPKSPIYDIPSGGFGQNAIYELNGETYRVYYPRYNSAIYDDYNETYAPFTPDRQFIKLIRADHKNILAAIPDVAEDGTVPIAEGNEPYPHLKSWRGDKPKACKLATEEAAWLTARMREGKIRLATEEDKKAWYKTATPGIGLVDCGRLFAIEKALVIPKKLNDKRNVSMDISFIVPKDVPFPKNPYGADTPIYDVQTGGGGMYGRYRVNDKEFVGYLPHYKPELYDDYKEAYPPFTPEKYVNYKAQ